MLPAGRHLRMPPLATGALALAAALAVGPSPAGAACGDYVTIVAPAANHPPAPAPTCHGCSRAPSDVAPVTAPATVERPAPDAVVGTGSTPPPPIARGRMTTSPAAPATPPASDIFHPPRAA